MDLGYQNPNHIPYNYPSLGGTQPQGLPPQDYAMMNQYNKAALNNFDVEHNARFDSREDKPDTKDDKPDENDNDDGSCVFDPKDKKVRLGFIRKVYIILCIQLLTTAVFVVMSFFVEGFRTFQQDTMWLMIVALVLVFVTIYALGCFRKLARSVPTNYILLTIFTLAESYMVSFIASFYDPNIVLLAASLTAAIVTGLTLYAIFTKTDFTTMGGILTVLLIGLIAGSILGIFIRNRVFHTILAVAGVIIFGIYLVYDTQLVIGKNSRAYAIDDYIFAALNLYIDIIQIFLYLLQILGSANN